MAYSLRIFWFHIGRRNALHGEFFFQNNIGSSKTALRIAGIYIKLSQQVTFAVENGRTLCQRIERFQYGGQFFIVHLYLLGGQFGSLPGFGDHQRHCLA
ncbi:hypothetical protein SDC9_203255 [bioreactor metagenome]|uniref:Uncharacterized protein n=1 Tax=bioreactor metagenome TaxID=1076179 RepID=A0A645IW53_9ZZZZ